MDSNTTNTPVLVASNDNANDKVMSPSRFTFSSAHIQLSDDTDTSSPVKKRRIDTSEQVSGNAPATNVSSQSLRSVMPMPRSPGMGFNSYPSSPYAGMRSPINKFGGFRSSARSPVPMRPLQFVSPRQTPTSRSPMNSFLRPILPSPINNSDDLLLITTMLKLLDRKKSLVTYLEQMNIAASRLEKTCTQETKLSDKLTDAFKQRYAWVIVQLEKTTQSLNSGLANLRRRRSEMQQPGIQQVPPTPLPLPPSHLPDSHIHVTTMAKQKANQMISHCRAQLVAEGRLPPFSPLARDSADEGGTQALLRSCVTLTVLLQYGIVSGSIPGDLRAIMEQLQPIHSENRMYYDVIEKSIDALQASLTK